MTRRDHCEQFLSAPPMNLPITEEPECVDALETFAQAERQRVWEEAAKECDSRRESCLKLFDGRSITLFHTEAAAWGAKVELLEHLSIWCRQRAQEEGN